MQRREFIKGTVAVSTMSQLPFPVTEILAAKAEKEKKKKVKIKNELEGNLKVLNQWGEQPTIIQRLYEAVFKTRNRSGLYTPIWPSIVNPILFSR